MSRTGSTSYRTTNSPFSATVGYGTRPTSAMLRPQSSFGTRKPNGPSVPRPATSLDTHTEDGASVLGKRKGMPISSVFFNSSAFCPVAPTLEPRPNSSWGHNPCSTTNSGLEEARMSFPTNTRSGAGVHLASRYLQKDPQISLHSTCQIPVGPGQSPKDPAISPPKSHRTPSLSPRRTPAKPPTPSFLTKDSSVTSFNHNIGAEWDQESKEKTMDEFFAAFMTRMNQQGQNSFGMKETLEMYKTRSKQLVHASVKFQF